MSVVGRVESVWRYPVKSMRGEELAEAFIGFSGVYGDRLYAFHNASAPPGFPYQTGRENEAMLLYQPRFRYPERAAKPPNLSEAEALAPGLTPLYARPADLAVDVQTPSGQVFAVDDPALLEMLGADGVRLSLLHSDRALTDCRPVSIFSLQTVGRIGEEAGAMLDKRRFRANIYVDLDTAAGFAEDGFISRRLRIGQKVVVAAVDRDPRCKMITLDPNTAQANPEILRKVAQNHEGKAGIYAAVLVEGRVRPGDPVDLLE